MGPGVLVGEVAGDATAGLELFGQLGGAFSSALALVVRVAEAVEHLFAPGDVLAGAPYDVLEDLDGSTAPLASVASAVTSDGWLSTGADVSCTVTVNVTWLWLPAESVAVTVTVLLPSGNTVPDAGLAVTVGAGSTASVAAGSANVTTAPLASVASAVTSDGWIRLGAVVSVTVTENVTWL